MDQTSRSSGPNGKSRSRKDVFVISGICLVLAGLVFISRTRLEKLTSDEPCFTRTAHVPVFRALRPFALGYHLALADILWVRTLRAFSQGITPEDGEWLDRTLNAITELDPFLYRAYTLGGLYLSVFAREPEKAVLLLQKGFHNLPHRWEIPFTIGYIYFHEMKDPGTAGKWFEVGTRIPGHPLWLPGLRDRALVQVLDIGLDGEMVSRMQEVVSDERLVTYWRGQPVPAGEGGHRMPIKRVKPGGGSI